VKEEVSTVRGANAVQLSETEHLIGRCAVSSPWWMFEAEFWHSKIYAAKVDTISEYKVRER
jgi:hypothetical protein